MTAEKNVSIANAPDAEPIYAKEHAGTAQSLKRNKRGELSSPFF